ncbi:hypothetical protein KB559_24120, partial [Paenibacillus sp. Marseille-P2973]|uniref:hypothetical protein n=1 Tax=Paenibacillus sp. Marseille-P2973 TaxID=1871032 RepID=UPI001B3963A8
VKVTKTLSLNNFIVRLASLGAVWQQGVIPQEQTTRWTGGYDFQRSRTTLWRFNGHGGRYLRSNRRFENLTDTRGVKV